MFVPSAYHIVQSGQSDYKPRAPSAEEAQARSSAIKKRANQAENAPLLAQTSVPDVFMVSDDMLKSPVCILIYGIPRMCEMSNSPMRQALNNSVAGLRYRVGPPK